jgi:lipid-A-disaccharide synthase
MRSWDGIPGLLANLPGMGSIFAKLINWWILKQKKLFAWPNIWAQEEIIPELVGELQAEEIALICVDFLENPHKLAKMRDSLLRLRHPTQAGQQMVRILVEKLLTH